jgi:hypothetical protein
MACKREDPGIGRQGLKSQKSKLAMVRLASGHSRLETVHHARVGESAAHRVRISGPADRCVDD